MWLLVAQRPSGPPIGGTSPRSRIPCAVPCCDPSGSGFDGCPRSNPRPDHDETSALVGCALDLDGKRLYATNPLLSSRDNRVYPELARGGSYLLQIDCATEAGGLTINERSCVDFSQEPAVPARAHEVRYLGGDCTSDIWL
jgi:selenium-binding protein 1